jgi:hypothetical protein
MPKSVASELSHGNVMAALSATAGREAVDIAFDLKMERHPFTVADVPSRPQASWRLAARPSSSSSGGLSCSSEARRLCIMSPTIRPMARASPTALHNPANPGKIVGTPPARQSPGKWRFPWEFARECEIGGGVSDRLWGVAASRASDTPSLKPLHTSAFPAKWWEAAPQAMPAFFLSKRASRR